MNMPFAYPALRWIAGQAWPLNLARTDTELYRRSRVCEQLCSKYLKTLEMPSRCHSHVRNCSKSSSSQRKTSLSSMISSSILSHLHYNTLPSIESQSPPSRDVLQDIGQIFVNYGAHKDFGVALLHKHFKLAAGEVMLHDGLRCSPAVPEVSAQISGNAFFLRNGEFQAFEYEQGALPPPDNQFLEKLRSHLSEHGLDSQLCLTRLDKEYPRLMEHCELGRTHVCEVTTDDIVPAEATEWRFDAIDSVIKATIARGCSRDANGGHKSG